MSARCLANSELLTCYSVPSSCIEPFLDNTEYTTNSNNMLPSCISVNLKSSTISQLINHSGFTDDRLYSASEAADLFQGYQMTASSTTIDWTSAYKKDKNTRIIYNQLTITSKPVWSSELLKDIQPEFHEHIKSDCIWMIHNKLIICKPIFKDLEYIGLIIVSIPLRIIICSHYHAGPSGAHMGEYKTLFRIRMRFRWPGMRRDIKLWIKFCAACVAYSIWTNRKSELYFSWHITSPFYIMYVDVWIPGNLLDEFGEILQLMN